MARAMETSARDRCRCRKFLGAHAIAFAADLTLVPAEDGVEMGSEHYDFFSFAPGVRHYVAGFVDLHVEAESASSILWRSTGRFLKWRRGISVNACLLIVDPATLWANQDSAERSSEVQRVGGGDERLGPGGADGHDRKDNQRSTCFTEESESSADSSARSIGLRLVCQFLDFIVSETRRIASRRRRYD